MHLLHSPITWYLRCKMHSKSLGPTPQACIELGRESRRWLETARHQVASLIGAKASGIIFTSGGTEACQLALHTLLHTTPRSLTRPRVITTATEHPAVLSALQNMTHLSLEHLPVRRGQPPTLETLKEALQGDTALVALRLGQP